MSVQRRHLKLKDCGVTNNMKNELLYFCLQYNEKKAAIRQNRGIHEVQYCKRAKTNRRASLTEIQAIYNTRYQKDIDLIEKTANDVDPIVAPYIIKNVTEKVPYEYLNAPINRTEFYAMRNYFLFLLAERRYDVY